MYEKKKEKRNSALTLDLERMNTLATGDLLNLQKFHLYGEATLKKKHFKLKIK